MRPSSFVCPSAPSAYASGATETSYLAVVGPHAAWPGESPRRLDDVDFAAEAGNTILLVEVANSDVPWMEPRDLSPDSSETAARLPELLAAAHPGGGQHDVFFFTYYYYAPGIHVLMADGNVRVLKAGVLSSEELQKLLQAGGCKDRIAGARVLFEERELRVNWPNIAALAVWLASVGALLVGAVRGRKVRSATLSAK